MQKTVVIDTNILFKSLRSRNEKLRDELFESGNRFVSAKYLIVELFEHKHRIVANTGCPEAEILVYLHEILKRIEFVDEETIHTRSYVEAFRLCRDVDEEDVPFVALALELDAELWTDDKRLKNGLRKKGFDQFYLPECF